MPIRRIDSSGKTETKTTSTGNTDAVRRQDSPTVITKEDRANDAALANKAREQKKTDPSAAKQTIASMKDPVARNQANQEIFNEDERNAKGAEMPPATLFADGSGSLSDPLALFFMMVFYLDKATPTFSWDDVLRTAEANSNQKFGTIAVSDAMLPQRQFEDSGNAKASTGIRGGIGAQEQESREAIEKQKNDNAQAAQNAKDQNTQEVRAQMGSAASGATGKGGKVIVWPVQAMPVIEGGLNKTVDWPTNQVATLAEPTIALNKGASPIEIDVEFTYGVGIYGIGDAEITAMTGGIDPTTGEPGPSGNPPKANDPKGQWWTVEQVMGMIYLATSLVYPFKSSPVVAAPEDKKAPPPEDDRTSAQFPVIFLRHYSLFPYLTPFVVKGVKIVPDENQPLIVTEPNQLKVGAANDLSYPAVRQIVKITLSLVSAHYYLPIFGGKDKTNEIKARTSGEVYLALARQLLNRRLEKKP